MDDNEVAEAFPRFLIVQGTSLYVQGVAPTSLLGLSHGSWYPGTGVLL